jgi:ABC-type multidrug transport system fused ATPase/permease subunit
VIPLVRQVLAILDARTRRGFLLAIPASIVMALFESVGFAMVLPFMQLLADPASLDRGGMLSKLHRLAGSPDRTTFIVYLGLVIFGSLLAKAVLAMLYLRWQTNLLARGEGELASRLFRAYLSADYSQHLRRHSSQLVRNVQESVQLVFSKMLLSLVQLIADGFLVVAIVATLLIIDPAAALAAGAVLGLAALAYTRRYGRRARGLGADDLDLRGQVQRQLQEGLSGLKALQAVDRVDPVARRFAVTRMRLARVRARQMFIDQLPRYLLEAAVVAALLVIVLMVVTTRSDADAVGTLGLLAAGAFRLMPSLQRFLSGGNAAYSARAAAHALVADMAGLPDEDAAERPAAARITPLDFQLELRFEDVSYTYPGTDERVVDHLDLVVRRGESVGLVGPSGAGKTTLVDLVLGLLRPTSGRILIDGHPLEGDRVSAWRAVVGYVPQDVFLFDDSVLHNIAIGLADEEIDRERVGRSIELAQFGPVLAELPEGLDTNMGERGVRLSGGQRQRLGIARALYGSPRVLVLDEATSSLDGITEAAFTDTVESLRADITLVVIAHRLSTVRRCDRIVLLAQGTVEASGSFDELVEHSDHFASLVHHAGLAGSSRPGGGGTLTAPPPPRVVEAAGPPVAVAATAAAGGVAVRSLAFYLPQFHPTPENDEWWGEGFTEWDQVRLARPKFRGHYQPHVPAGGEYYDLRDAAVRQRQADLARRYGLSGFVYYHYWFAGKRLLERPFTEVLATGEPDFGFCLCWANEDWTRAWTGASREVLVSHRSSPEDDRVHARSLLEAFADPRAIKVDGRAVLLIHHSRSLPDVRRTIDTLRDEVSRAGLPGLYLCRVESDQLETGDPTALGFDAAIDFHPTSSTLPTKGYGWRSMRRLTGRRGRFGRRVHRYDDVVDWALVRPPADYKRYPCVMPSWDNTARRRRGSLILHDATPASFGRWSEEALRRFTPFSRDENLVFLQAWNEWGEGNHLEPDEKWGTGWLEAYAAALERAGRTPG